MVDRVSRVIGASGLIELVIARIALWIEATSLAPSNEYSHSYNLMPFAVTDETRFAIRVAK
ncbi:MAG: hypothetical protein ACXV3U_00510 [Halobacteriota archaeon]